MEMAHDVRCEHDPWREDDDPADRGGDPGGGPDGDEDDRDREAPIETGSEAPASGAGPDEDEDSWPEDGPDAEDGPESEEEAEPGYAWTFAEQEARLPEEYERHMDLLDDLEAREILALDLSREGDYLLWAAAQSLEEQGWVGEAIALLRRIGRGPERSPALRYPEIRLRLQDLLRERGDYDEALSVLEEIEREDPERRETCRERRAEVMILLGRIDEGLELFEAAVRATPDDPWIHLSAAWALIRVGGYDDAMTWIARAERGARRLEDEEEIGGIDAEVERLRNEARIRRERRERAQAAAPAAPRREERAGVRAAASSGPPDAPAEDAAPPPATTDALKQSILADLDAEEVRLTTQPPRSGPDRAAAIARLSALHQRATAAWDDAVERKDDRAIETLDDLQWEVVEVAERFGLELPGVEKD